MQTKKRSEVKTAAHEANKQMRRTKVLEIAERLNDAQNRRKAQQDKKRPSNRPSKHFSIPEQTLLMTGNTRVVVPPPKDMLGAESAISKPKYITEQQKKPAKRDASHSGKPPSLSISSGDNRASTSRRNSDSTTRPQEHARRLGPAHIINGDNQTFQPTPVERAAPQHDIIQRSPNGNTSIPLSFSVPFETMIFEPSGSEENLPDESSLRGNSPQKKGLRF